MPGYHPPVNVRSTAGFLRELERHQAPRHGWWFRGHGKHDWRLVPSISRGGFGFNREGQLFRRFKQNATPYVDPYPRSEWEWLFLMQHYRVPTRLLDWTESAAVGLYFAVADPKHDRVDGALWALDPVGLNTSAGVDDVIRYTIPSAGDDEVINDFLPSVAQRQGQPKRPPIAILAPRSERRIQAQAGTFVVFHRDLSPLEGVNDGSHLWKLRIRANDKKRIRKELSALGITELAVFPGLESAGRLTSEELR